jgi:hypothetical protein
MVVANIQMKNLKIEAEKGFRRTLFGPELVGPNLEINFVKGEEAGFVIGVCITNSFTIPQ